MNIFFFPSIWLILAGLFVFLDKPIWWLFAAFAVLFGAMAYGGISSKVRLKDVPMAELLTFINKEIENEKS
jgi:hypothetical protein